MNCPYINTVNTRFPEKMQKYGSHELHKRYELHEFFLWNPFLSRKLLVPLLLKLLKKAWSSSCPSLYLCMFFRKNHLPDKKFILGLTKSILTFARKVCYNEACERKTFAFWSMASSLQKKDTIKNLCVKVLQRVVFYRDAFLLGWSKGIRQQA